MNKIIIFVKAPVPGRVKTRLCPPLSNEQAATLYQAFAQDTLHLAERVRDAAVEVAYQSNHAFADLKWMRTQPPITYFPQRGRDLGKRLVNAFDKAFSEGIGKTVVIGSDTPHLSPAVIESAFSALDRAEVALGPADDGGYYLIALRKACPGLFRGISWSTEKVLHETSDRAKKLNLQTVMLPRLADIDTVDDLERLARKLRGASADYCPATRHAIKRILRPAPADQAVEI